MQQVNFKVLMNVSEVLWLAQVFLTFFPAWFLYSLHRQSKSSGYREQSALPFSVALFTWTVAGATNTLLAFSGHMPFGKSSSSTLYETFAVVRVLLSTINTLFLTIGVTRLDNFPARFGGGSLRRLSDRQWVAIGVTLLAAEVLAAGIGGWKAAQWLDMGYGFLALIPLTIGLFKTFLRYEMGKLLTAAIISALMLLEAVLFYLAFFWSGDDSPEQVLFLTSILVTSKVAFMMVLVMVVAAWGRYYTSGTVEEVIRGGTPQRVRLLLIPGRDAEYARRKAYDAILSYWPDSPAFLEAVKTERPSSKEVIYEVIAASRNPQMIADLIEAGILNLSLSYIGDGVTTELMSAATRAEKHSHEQLRRQTG